VSGDITTRCAHMSGLNLYTCPKRRNCFAAPARVGDMQGYNAGYHGEKHRKWFKNLNILRFAGNPPLFNGDWK
jgi:hypothetical protein